MFELESGAETMALLNAGGWTLLTAVNLDAFQLDPQPLQYDHLYDLQRDRQ